MNHVTAPDPPDSYYHPFDNPSGEPEPECTEAGTKPITSTPIKSV